MPGKATLRPLFVSRRLLNPDPLLKWARALGVGELEPAAELHVTLIASRVPVDWMLFDESYADDLVVSAGGPRVVELFGEERSIAVLAFKSMELSWRHETFVEHGASWDWPEYQPHVTFSANASGLDVTEVEAFQGELRFGPERFELFNTER